MLHESAANGGVAKRPGAKSGGQLDGEGSGVVGVGLAVDARVLLTRAGLDRGDDPGDLLIRIALVRQPVLELILPVQPPRGFAQLQQEGAATGAGLPGLQRLEDEAALLLQPFVQQVFQRAVFGVLRDEALREKIRHASVSSAAECCAKCCGVCRSACRSRSRYRSRTISPIPESR